MEYRFANISQTDKELAAKELWTILEKYLEYLSTEDKQLVELAFTEMVIAHGEQRRKSGEYYFVHPVAACLILADIHLDKSTLAAALLHDVPEDTTMTLRDLAKDFDTEIVGLVEGVTKFSTLKYRGEQRYAENLRKLFLAMNRDIRIVLIKLADRIHNLQTLNHLRPDKQYRIALESLEIYAPIAERLGISRLRSQIEDLAFPYVYPDHYKQFVQLSNVEITKRTAQLDVIVKQVEKQLKRHKIPFFSVRGRAKTYYSIYRKLVTKERKIEDVFDLIAIRLVTYTVEQCYEILSMIHQLFEPIPDRVKDYINEPKENGYQSIHTAVRANDGTILEVQIRTREMDEYAEFGVATHWAYKEGETLDFNPSKFRWISDVVNLGKQWGWQKDYVRKVKMNLYSDRIFVMTPRGDVVDLQAGATALDFAYKIHEEVGSTAHLAKINGRSARLNEKLSNGDVIEIVTQKNQRPTLDWLSKVSTGNAIKKIRGFLNGITKQEEEKIATKK
jgi:GTP diphosphokinase / guanosine-3',5'-bis(diphosphate) 3'-diphosphatase